MCSGWLLGRCKVIPCVLGDCKGVLGGFEVEANVLLKFWGICYV